MYGLCMNYTSMDFGCRIYQIPESIYDPISAFLRGCTHLELVDEVDQTHIIPRDKTITRQGWIRRFGHEVEVAYPVGVEGDTAFDAFVGAIKKC